MLKSIDFSVDQALKRREPLFRNPATNAYRIIHRYGDGVLDIAVDRYDSGLVAHLYESSRLNETQEKLLKRLFEKLKSKAVYVKVRPREAKKIQKDSSSEQLNAGPWIGESIQELKILENGMNFLIRPEEGLSSGLFLDMRDLRAWIRANSFGKTFLNCFAYTCAFGVSAVLGGASRVVNLDLSKKYLEWGKRNMQLNGLSAEPQDFIYGDVFDWLNRFGKREQKFDWLMLDPPSHSSSKESRFSSAKDYEKLVKAAATLVSTGGILFVCCNTEAVSRQLFEAQVKRGLAGFRYQIFQRMQAPAMDFPIGAKAESYLKILLIRIL